MGSALGKDVVEVISDADEGEAEFHELSDTVSAEEEDSGDLGVLLAGGKHLLNSGVEFRGGVHEGELVLLIEAHGHAQVIGAEESDVQSGEADDLIDVGDAVSSLNLHSDDHILVGVEDVAEESVFVGAPLGEVDRSGALGRVQAAGNGGFGLFLGVDVGNQDSVRAEVQSLLDAHTVVAAAHTHHGLGLAVGDGGEHGSQGHVVHGAVLHVH